MTDYTYYLNQMIGSQQRHNADVTRHIFSDTLHMLHRLKYPKEYNNHFLRKNFYYHYDFIDFKVRTYVHGFQDLNIDY